MIKMNKEVLLISVVSPTGAMIMATFLMYCIGMERGEKEVMNNG